MIHLQTMVNSLMLVFTVNKITVVRVKTWHYHNFHEKHDSLNIWENWAAEKLSDIVKDNY